MRELTLSLVFSTLVLVMSAVLLTQFEIESLRHLFLAGLMVGLLNFIIAPMLLTLRVKPNTFNLGFTTFVLNFLMLNVSTGLIDDFGKNSWVAALFGSVILAFFQVIMDRKDPTRRKLIT